VCCVCVRVHMFSFVWKISTHFPLLRRTPSSQLWSSSCGHLVGFHSHGMSWSTPTAWWFTMENHGKSHEILWKSYGNPMEIGWFRATPMETPMILVASFDSLDYSNTKWHSHGHAACWCVFKWLFNGKICIYNGNIMLYIICFMIFMDTMATCLHQKTYWLIFIINHYNMFTIVYCNVNYGNITTIIINITM
jgi:hypothetical protein